eukprot:117362-Amphidinium_carterae.1
MPQLGNPSEMVAIETLKQTTPGESLEFHVKSNEWGNGSLKSKPGKPLVTNDAAVLLQPKRTCVREA